jgi:hypothetical protein
MKILIQIEIFAERPDMSGHITGQARKSLLESGEEARHIRCLKPNNLVYKTWETERNMKDIDMIHIGSYHFENGILDITMSFQFIHLWTSFNDFSWERGYSRNFIQETDIMDLRGISSLMASQQAIKVNNSHKWIDMVTKTKKL